MLRDLALAAKAACSREDQESLVPMVKQLRDLGEIAFKRGLLALEGELMQIRDPFLKLGIQLIVDKTEPENVQDILDSDIYYNESPGASHAGCQICRFIAGRTAENGKKAFSMEGWSGMVHGQRHFFRLQ